MDNRDMESIRDIEKLDRVLKRTFDRPLKRTQPEPAPSWTTLFFVAVFGAFMAWMLMSAIEKATFDLVNTIEVE